MNFDINDLKKLKEFLTLNNINFDDVCLVGSSTLSLLGIRNHDDIDLIIKSKYITESIIKHDYINFVQSPWSSIYSDDEIIDNNKLHIKYDNFKFVCLELLFHKKKWHNRDKDYKDIIEIIEFSKSNIFNWELINKNLPKNNHLFFLRNFKIIFLKIKRKIKRFFLNRYLHKDCFQIIPTNILLSRQTNGINFLRYDLIVRYLTIKYYLEQNKDYDLYKKLQKERGKSPHKNPIKAFKVLINNFKLSGYNFNKPIALDKNLKLIDGSHRLACALYFNIAYVPVKIIKTSFISPFDINWFKTHNFSKEEIDHIKINKIDVFKSTNAYFQIVLWPPVEKFFNEIEKIIKKKYEIISTVDYANVRNFNEYVRNLYKIDDINKWKVERKISLMDKYPKNIRIIDIIIKNPEYRKKGNKNLISVKVEELKRIIRKKYSNNIDNYFHDIIIHIGDNFNHTSRSRNLNINA